MQNNIGHYFVNVTALSTQMAIAAGLTATDQGNLNVTTADGCIINNTLWPLSQLMLHHLTKCALSQRSVDAASPN